MLRARADGVNEKDVEAESEGEGQHRVGVAVVVSYTTSFNSLRIVLSNIPSLYVLS